MLIGRSRRPIIAPVSSYSSPRHRKVGMREKASL